MLYFYGYSQVNNALKCDCKIRYLKFFKENIVFYYIFLIYYLEKQTDDGSIISRNVYRCCIKNQFVLPAKNCVRPDYYYFSSLQFVFQLWASQLISKNVQLCSFKTDIPLSYQPKLNHRTLPWQVTWMRTEQHPHLPKRLQLHVVHSSHSHLTHNICNCVYQTGRVKNSFAHDLLLHRQWRSYISSSEQFPFIA